MAPTPPRAWGLHPHAALFVPPDTDVLCGTEPPGPRHGLALARLRLEPALRCTEPTACVPCLEARVRLALSPATSTATESRLSVQPGTSETEDSGDGGQWSPVTGATSSQPKVTGLLLLSGHTYASSRCVAVEVWAPLRPTLRGRTVVCRCGAPGMGVPTLSVPGHWGCGRWHQRISVAWGSRSRAPGRWVLAVPVPHRSGWWFSCPGLGDLPVLRGAAGLRTPHLCIHELTGPAEAEPAAAGVR